jgi:mono/diheme cytochrome c family protein
LTVAIAPWYAAAMRGWVVFFLVGCSGDATLTLGPSGTSPGTNSSDSNASDMAHASDPNIPPPPAGAMAIPAEPQRTNGDAARGYTSLVNQGYVNLGFPWDGFALAMTPLDPKDSLPGRTGKNATVGYAYNVSIRPGSVEVAAPNCLACHAAPLDGKIYVGLGRPQHFVALPTGSVQNATFVTAGFTSPDDWSEYNEYGTRLSVGGEAGFLMGFASMAAHHDPKTLAWLDAPSFDASTGLVGWVDVPPWWRVKKVNGLYYNGMGRGEQAHHMMNMSLFSVQSVSEAHSIDDMFTDIAAYIRSIEPPKYPRPLDPNLVSQGEGVFNQNCASCHGTYGGHDSYPNLLIPLALVDTDASLAKNPWANLAAAAWWSSSVYGTSGSRFEPFEGYLAPPLDGIWVTAPFFHNGSVPTLEGVLDSSKRPSTWTMAFDGVYDYDAVGWTSTGSGADPIYDTSQLGYSKQGHTFGDSLSSTDRRAVLEYLKTL